MKNKQKIVEFCYLLFLILQVSVAPVMAQSDPTGEKRITSSLAIVNATVYTSPYNYIENATVLIKDGLIHSVGQHINVPLGTQVIPGDSLLVYPGFIDGASYVGISPPIQTDRSRDFDPSSPDDEVAGITPWREASDQFDPTNNKIIDWRKTGFTIAQLVPEGGMLPGKTTLITFGNDNSTNILASQTSLYAKFKGASGMYPATQMGIMAKFRDLYHNAGLSFRYSTQSASTAGLPRPEINKTLEAFYPALDKNIPIYFEVSEDLEMRRALSLQKEFGFRMVLVGVSDVEPLINDIKASGTQVLLSLDLPEDKASKVNSKNESSDFKARIERVKLAYQDHLKQASYLEKAGIKFGFTSINAQPDEALKNIRLMVTNGLSEEGALEALTISNADILGIQRLAGTIEKGKLANLVVTSEPLLKKDTQILYVIADGHVFENKLKSPEAKENKKENEVLEELDGLWEYVADTPDGSMGGTMLFNSSKGELSGTITYENPAGGGKSSSAMEKIILSQKVVTFTFEVMVKGNRLTVHVKGEIERGSFTGKFILMDFGTYPLLAQKIDAPLSHFDRDRHEQ